LGEKIVGKESIEKETAELLLGKQQKEITFLPGKEKQGVST